jgi:hypothetical protein
MLSSDRLNRAVVRLRSERPADWRDELDSLETERVRGRSVRLKHASISELSALVVLLEERPTGDRATFHDAVWRRIALRRRLRLTNDSCYGKPQNPACRCGAQGLDALTDDELQPMTLMQARARVQALAKERHQRTPRPRKPKPKPASLPTGATLATRLAEMPPGHLQSPPQPPQPPAETSEPPPLPRPRSRPVHRSPKWYDEDERRSILDYKF